MSNVKVRFSGPADLPLLRIWSWALGAETGVSRSDFLVVSFSYFAF